MYIYMDKTFLDIQYERINQKQNLLNIFQKMGLTDLLTDLQLKQLTEKQTSKFGFYSRNVFQLRLVQYITIELL